MLVISSAELRNNMKKYLDLAKDETVVIQRGRTETFVLSRQERISPDANLASAISAEELLIGIEEDLKKMFSRKAKNESAIFPIGTVLFPGNGRNSL
jgi:hypothetical protein